ncbi:MAG TPA: hypothetical protein ENJ95_21645 [Bacteroidetes bacterium]|nr:hypothetical protein [Bacteroidota bacterium]
MKKYLHQLLGDIAFAKANVSSPYPEKTSYEIWEWVSEEEEEKTAPRIPLEAWTGIKKEQLPPADMLTDEEIHLIFPPLKEMLEAYNWLIVFVIEVPERLQYKALRENFDQEAVQKRWHMGLFETCKKGTPHGQCALGEEYCQCAYFAELHKDMVDEDLTPEEERARELDCEITYLKIRHGSDWMRYYPYHLDPDYDDKDGNPHDYGFGDLDEEEDEDDWWKK